MKKYVNDFKNYVNEAYIINNNDKNKVNKEDMITNGTAYLNTKITPDNYYDSRDNYHIIFYVPENVTL